MGYVVAFVLGAAFGAALGIVGMHSRSSAPAETKSLDGPREYEVEVVGESNYQDSLDAVAGGKTKEGHDAMVPAVCVPEDDNPYDENAVAVTLEGKIVGHLSREAARYYREAHGEQRVQCRARLKGGWDRGGGNEGSYGVTLYLRA